MAAKNSIQAIPYTSVLASAFNAVNYTAINPNGLDEACFLLKINNLTDKIVIISYDGVNAHDQIDCRGTLEVYGGLGSSSSQTNYALWAKGQIVYVRGTAGGNGALTLCGYYQPN